MAVLLDHVNPESAVGRIDHQLHGTVWAQHLPQHAQPKIRVGQVMEHAGADDEIEILAQLAHPLDRQLMQRQVGEFVLALQTTCVPQTRLADIDAGDARSRLTEWVSSRLRSSAAGYQNLLVADWSAGRPCPMEQRSAALRIAA